MESKTSPRVFGTKCLATTNHSYMENIVASHESIQKWGKGRERLGIRRAWLKLKVIFFKG